MDQTNAEQSGSSPFEGPEKLLEIWFTPSAGDVPDAHSPENGKTGLRKIDPSVWEDMLDIVQCKVLSMVRGQEMDAYLLSESSFFVSPHRIILKTCGTTLNLLGLPRILEIAATQAGMPSVYRCFYSRKSFMFPERQPGVHRDWKHEVEFLDNIFHNGAAYTVGKVNGDHWLLYITSPQDDADASSVRSVNLTKEEDSGIPDHTIEILMSDLSPAARRSFFSSALSPSETPSSHAQSLSSSLGITNIFPPELTTLDAYTFSPCGYSSNALIRIGDVHPFTSSRPAANGENGTAASLPTPGEGYYTIHVTPEDGWSYASFECNLPLPASHPASSGPQSIPDLKTLIQRVVAIFQPGRLSLTLFISSEDNEGQPGEDSAIEAAQRAFKAALTGTRQVQNGSVAEEGSGASGGIHQYKRTDKINYEFGGYDLAFASFEAVEKQPCAGLKKAIS